MLASRTGYQRTRIYCSLLYSQLSYAQRVAALLSRLHPRLIDECILFFSPTHKYFPAHGSQIPERAESPQSLRMLPACKEAQKMTGNLGKVKCANLMELFQNDNILINLHIFIFLQ